MKTLILGILCFGLMQAQTNFNNLNIIPTPSHTAVGQENFFNQAQTHKITLKSPASLGADSILTLPPVTGSAGCVIDAAGTGVLTIGSCTGFAVPLVLSGTSSSPILTVTQLGTGTAETVNGPGLFSNGIQVCGTTTCPPYNQEGIIFGVNTAHNPWAVNGAAGVGDSTICDYIGCEGDFWRIKGGGNYWDITRVKADNSGVLPVSELSFLRDSTGRDLIHITESAYPGTLLDLTGELRFGLCQAPATCTGIATDIGFTRTVRSAVPMIEVNNGTPGTPAYLVASTLLADVGVAAPLLRIDNTLDNFTWSNTGLGTHHFKVTDSSAVTLLDYTNPGAGVWAFTGQIQDDTGLQAPLTRTRTSSDYFDLTNVAVGGTFPTHTLYIRDSSAANIMTYTNPAGTGNWAFVGNMSVGALTVSSCSGCAAGAVTSVSPTGSGINATPTTGAVVISNTGVTSNVAGANIGVSGATGAVTIREIAPGATNQIPFNSSTTGPLTASANLDFISGNTLRVGAGAASGFQVTAPLFNSLATGATTAFQTGGGFAINGNGDISMHNGVFSIIGVTGVSTLDGGILMHPGGSPFTFVDSAVNIAGNSLKLTGLTTGSGGVMLCGAAGGIIYASSGGVC